ncbi:hypothetical protein [Staphylococcus pseudoxylosus]|uniref:hypothetical protein n=1 Tax=Staphylococcus pseudoxylosus TaxID=2282419 RepID=UPI003018DFEC
MQNIKNIINNWHIKGIKAYEDTPDNVGYLIANHYHTLGNTPTTSPENVYYRSYTTRRGDCIDNRLLEDIEVKEVFLKDKEDFNIYKYQFVSRHAQYVYTYPLGSIKNIKSEYTNINYHEDDDRYLKLVNFNIYFENGQTLKIDNHSELRETESFKELYRFLTDGLYYIK